MRWRMSTIRTKGVYIDDLSGKTLSNDTVMETQRTEFNTAPGHERLQVRSTNRSSVSRQDL